MKQKFSSFDIIAMINELQCFLGMRVNQVYDIDNKTYLIRLNRYEEKVVLLLESGVRFHTTDFEWPKNPSPSGFSMKLRKHIKNKRLEKLSQVGVDRIIDLQFGTNEAAYHVILELYDRGNIVLTDFEYTILNILRPRTDGSEDVKFIVREKYPVESIVASKKSRFDKDEIYAVLNEAKDGESLKKILMKLTAFGPAVLDHVLLQNNFNKSCAINKDFKVPADINRLFVCLDDAECLLGELQQKSCGYIFHKVEKSADSQEIFTNVEFHPYLFAQFSDMKYTEYPSFNKAVDNYFSSMEGQKIDIKALQKEKEALKKLENVKKDHEQRLVKLHESQESNIKKAQLIEMNSELVDKAITVIRSALANQISWSDILDIIKEAQSEGDPVAKSIKKLKLGINHFTLLLNPAVDSEEETLKPEMVDIDLGCSAYANARKYYDLKRAHAKKEQKTLESSEKAFKNAEKKTKQALKEVAVTTSITKARKVMWFEKFLWFISSENYLVIAGRDIQQNELLVKRYMKSNDLYVHADLHGASSVIIKNPIGGPVPPKTLNEAGTMAVCNSTAWDAKIVINAWWVYSNQVSKTAPTGEYLTTGSFMIRGKKNYLPPANLIMGFGFMFKLDDESIENHLNERCERSETESEVASVRISESSSLGGIDDELSENEEEESRRLDEVPEQLEEKTSESSSDSEPDLSDHSKDVGDEKLDEQDLTEQSVAFPDTEIKLNALSEDTSDGKEKDVKVSTSGIILQEHKKRVKKQGDDDCKKVPAQTAKEKNVAPKRGQRGKLKKIREKYKDQDEEERLLRMKIVGAGGPSKENKKNKKKKKNALPAVKPSKAPREMLKFIEKAEENTIIEVKGPENSQIKVSEEVTEKNQDVEVSDEENDEDQVSDEIKLLNSLTGCPVLEDTLLYAVPVCGPYSSLLSYKFKVKIIPGTNRRGKAAKNALNIFLYDKATSSREKDLLRSVKDQDISRNLPGKVKLLTASYKKVK